MAERTVTISGLSKTYSVTGWRIGLGDRAARAGGGIRKVHDFLTVGAPTPLQEAGASPSGCPIPTTVDWRPAIERLRDCCSASSSSTASSATNPAARTTS